MSRGNAGITWGLCGNEEYYPKDGKSNGTNGACDENRVLTRGLRG